MGIRFQVAPAEQVAAANGYGCHASCCAGDHASRSRG
jgi:hypothetical protein